MYHAEEGVELGEGALETLGNVSGGDMRKAITTLQSAFRLNGSPVIPQTIMDVAGTIPKDVAESLVENCKMAPFQKVQECVENILADGFPAQEILLKIQGLVLTDTSIGENARAKILIKLAEADKELVDGSDEYLQILSLASYIQQTLTAA